MAESLYPKVNLVEDGLIGEWRRGKLSPQHELRLLNQPVCGPVLNGPFPQPAEPADLENMFLLGTAGLRLGDAKTRVRLTWAASEQGSWQCSMSGTQAFFTSSLKKCLLETLTTLASFPKRRKDFTRSSSLSCGRDT